MNRRELLKLAAALAASSSLPGTQLLGKGTTIETEGGHLLPIESGRWYHVRAE